MKDLIQCEKVSKNYGKVIGLQQLSLSIPSGKIVGILGPNGSGKTTFIKILSGLLTPEEGTVLVDGKPIGVESKAVVSYLPERQIGRAHV